MKIKKESGFLGIQSPRCRPVARIFYGWVQSNEDTDQTRPEAQVSKGKIGMWKIALHT